MPNLWEKCPKCGTEMQPNALDLYHESISICLRFNWCRECNTINGVDAKFMLVDVH